MAIQNHGNEKKFIIMGEISVCTGTVMDTSLTLIRHIKNIKMQNKTKMTLMAWKRLDASSRNSFTKKLIMDKRKSWVGAGSRHWKSFCHAKMGKVTS